MELAKSATFVFRSNLFYLIGSEEDFIIGIPFFLEKHK